MANLEDLSAVTLHPKFVHKFGDRPYFSSELNLLISGELTNVDGTASGSSYFTPQQPPQIFLKFKSSTDSYTWGKITDVVDGGEPYTWSGKQIRIKFAIEGHESLVSCVSISAKPLDQTDIREYLIRRTARQHSTSDDRDAIDGSEVVPPVADEVQVDYNMLPTTAVCNEVKNVIQQRIVRRPITDTDVASLEEYASALHAYPGNLAVKHTNTMLANLREETQVGHTTSYHQTGFSTKAHTRRLADRTLSDGNGGDFSQLSQGSFSQLSQSDLLTQEHFAATQPVLGSQSLLSPFPASPSQVALTQSQYGASSSASLPRIDAARFMEARRNEETFRDYIGAPARSGFVDFLAEKTRNNAALNAKATVLAMSKGTQQKSNMIQSTGLWITDDELRKQTAEDFASSRGDSTDESKKAAQKKPAAPQSVKPTTVAAAAPPPAAPVVVASATPQRSSSLTSRDELCSVFSSNEDNDDDWISSPVTPTITSPASATASPNILAAGVSPLSQLIFHASASQQSISRKRSREEATA